MSEAGADKKWRPKPCPICQKMSVERYHPFCSKRCADIDLGKWLGGGYAIPTDERAPVSGDFEDDETP